MGREKTRSPFWQLRIAIPGLMVAVFLLDAGLRLMPIDPLTFRAWEALARYRPPGTTFEPNRRYDNARSYGNLARAGNFPDLRQYRPVRVTTDALGYRNAPQTLRKEINAILAGDSFAVGGEVSDDQTLSARLTKLTGCVVYNAGGLESESTPDRILALARRLHLQSRLVIRLYGEEGRYVEALPIPRHGTGLLASMPVGLRDLMGRLLGFSTVSPLHIVSEHALMRVEDDRVLPNRYAVRVVRGTLSNGESMLFWGPSVHHSSRKGEITLGYWKWLRDDLQKARFDLLVVLVPSKYRVYRPFLVNPPSLDPDVGDYLDRLGSALRKMGIPVLDLTPVLSAEAARALRHGEYLYWLDDFHWNARGIALAAEAMRERWPLTEASCKAPLPGNAGATRPGPPLSARGAGAPH